MRPALALLLRLDNGFGELMTQQLQRFFRPASYTIGAAALVLLLVNIVAAWQGWQRSELQAPTPSRWLTDRNGEFLAEFEAEVSANHQPPQHDSSTEPGYGYWPLAAVPERVSKALLALEDRRFHQHAGVDLQAVGRALLQNIRHGERISGASTLAMQVARMQSPGSRYGVGGYWRKLREAWTALFLTQRYGRNGVLAHYLRLVPYGNRSHGIEHAARLYFDKPVADLSWAEISLLSAIPQAPGISNLFRSSGLARARKRGQQALDELQEIAVIDAAEYALATAQLRELQVRLKPQRPAEALHAVLQLKRQTAGEFAVVKSTLDMNLQRAAAAAIVSRLEQWRAAGAEQMALIVIDIRSAEIRSWLGSPDYRQRFGAIDYANVARSPGSTLKPFIYAQALDEALMHADTLVDDLPENSANISNADRRFLGPMLPRVALANSRNVPAARVLRRLGLESAYWNLQELGLHRHNKPAEQYGLSMAVGSLPTNLSALSRAYLTLAGNGSLPQLRWFDSQPKNTATAVFRPATAQLLTRFLADPQARLPGFPRMGSTEYPFPVALKTGTSQGYRDAWTVAWSADYLVASWIGRADAMPMQALGGAGSAAKLTRDVLLQLHEHSAPTQRFAEPQGYQRHQLCAYTGAAASQGCPRSVREWLPTGQQPRAASDEQVAINLENGQRAGSETPATQLAVRRFATVQPRYQQWAAREGLLPPGLVPTRNRPEAMRTSFVTNVAGRTALQAAISDDTPKLRITSPTDGSVLIRNPAMPSQLNSIALRSSDNGSPLLWTINGTPYRATAAGESIRWQLKTGRHCFVASLAGSAVRSGASCITVR